MLLNCPKQSHSPTTLQSHSASPWTQGCQSEIRSIRKEAVISWTSNFRSRVNPRAVVRRKKRCICGSTTAAIGLDRMHRLRRDFAFPNRYSRGSDREEFIGHPFFIMMRHKALMMLEEVFSPLEVQLSPCKKQWVSSHSQWRQKPNSIVALLLAGLMQATMLSCCATF